MSPYVDQKYAAASIATGKSVKELREMARDVFASMLYHAEAAKGQVVWVAIGIGDHGLHVEVDIPRRTPTAVTP